jgi:nucleotide-binding universal stress UspA family protein
MTRVTNGKGNLMFKTILLATDGSKEAAKAEQTAIDLARENFTIAGPGPPSTTDANSMRPVLAVPSD